MKTERCVVLRVPGVHDFTVGLNVALAAMEIIALTLIYVEWRTDRVRLPYVIVLAFFVLVHLLLEPVSNSTTFRAAARWAATL